MSNPAYTITKTRETEGGRTVEVTVTTPDFDQMTVTVQKSVAESAMLDVVIEAALRSRQRTIEQLQPGPE